MAKDKSKEYGSNQNSGSERECLLEGKGLRKVFDVTVAVDNVDIELYRGQVTAIVGENGAGKSTLKNLLIGVFPPNKGEIQLEGKNIAEHSAVELGIAAVHQEFSLFPSLSVAENICITDFPGRALNIKWSKVRQTAKNYLDMIGTELDLDAPVETLSTGEQQIVEIAKALRQATCLIIFDEPTTSLTEPEREKLFDVIARLKEQNFAIAYITHFMNEVYEIADTAVVMRDGNHVGGGAVSDLPQRELEELMVGRKVEERQVDIGTPSDETVLRVDGLNSNDYRDISFEVKRGEIVGISGLMGAGRTEVVESIFGIRPSMGKITINNEKLENPTSEVMMGHGIGFIPEDRRREGLFEIRSLRENLTIAYIKQMVDRVLPGIGFKNERENALQIANDFRLVYSDIENDIRFLSGGNQQKALLARWLSKRPRICIMDEPTRGVDIGAKEEIHELMADLARAGSGILFVSSEIPELMLLSHRILVMRKGRMVHEMKREDFDAKKIIKHSATSERVEE